MSVTSETPQVCFCHGEPTEGQNECRVKRRARQRRYWTIGGWARRRERRLEVQRKQVTDEIERLDQEAEDLGIA